MRAIRVGSRKGYRVYGGGGLKGIPGHAGSGELGCSAGLVPEGHNLEGSRTPGAEFVAVNRYGRSLIVTAEDGAEDDQLQGTGFVEQDWPVDRQLDGKFGMQVRGVEPNSAAGNVETGGGSGGHDSRAADENFKTQLLLDRKAAFGTPLLG